MKSGNMKSIVRNGMMLCLAGVLLAGCGAQSKSRAAQAFKAPPMPPAPPVLVKMPLDPALRTLAQKHVDRSLASADGLARMHGIEITQQTRGSDGAPIYFKALSDTDPHVRYAATLAIGASRATSAYAAVFTHVDDPDQRVQLATRYALHRLGDFRLSKDFEKFAASGDPSMRAETARLLGLLEEPTAINLLRSMLKDPEPGVKLQVTEAMFHLGDLSARNRILAGTLSLAADARIISLQALGLSRDKAYLPHIRAQLTSEYMEVNLAAARAAGMLGSDDGMGVALQGAQSVDARQRQMAAFALGDIGRSDAQPVLAKLLADKDGDTQLAAAGAILKLKAP